MAFAHHLNMFRLACTGVTLLFDEFILIHLGGHHFLKYLVDHTGRHFGREKVPSKEVEMGSSWKTSRSKFNIYYTSSTR